MGVLHGEINKHMSTVCDRLIAIGLEWVCRNDKRLLVVPDINILPHPHRSKEPSDNQVNLAVEDSALLSMPSPTASTA